MKVIAKINRRITNPTLGFIKPKFHYDENLRRYTVVGPEMFPNDGEVFIYGGFANIDNQVQDDELFELDNIAKNEVNYNPSNPQSCYYSASADSFRRLSKTEFVTIIKGEFDFNGRTIKADRPIPHTFDYPIFVNAGEFLYGPFNYSDNVLYPLDVSYFEEDDFILNEEVENVFLDNRDCIFKYKLSEISDFILGDYVIDLSALVIRAPFEVLFFGTKESILSWGKSFFKSKLTDQESQLLSKLKDIVIPTTGNDIEKQKLKYLFSYLNEGNNWVNVDLPRYVNGFFQTPSGINYIEKFLNDNKISFFNEYKKDEIDEIELSILNKQQELGGLEHQVKDLQNKLESQDDKIFEGIGENEKSLLKEIIKDSQLREKMLQHHRENTHLEEIEKKINEKIGERNFLQKDIDGLIDRQKIITEAIKNVKNDFFQDSDFAKKVMDAKIYTDLINNIDPSQTDDSRKNLTTYKPLIINSSTFENSKTFISEIQNRLESLDRKLSFNDVANYLISIQQNFLVVFAGLPGVGKTSLIEKIAKALGCVDNERYLKIPVSKGWTSSKDLLGYYNPLTKRYQSSKTGLYEALELSESDSKNKVIVPNFILLDEANLSSIEHYWSDFLSVSDDEYVKSIKVTDTSTINFGEGVRFLATINYDHTTEVLSNRLISRAPIIKLTNNGIYGTDIIESFKSVFDIFSMNKITTGLQPKSNKDYFKDDVKNKFDGIIKTLEEDNPTLGNSIIVGYRKYLAVEKYCRVAGLIMEDENKFTALDFAVNQNILPLINGRGDNFNKRLHLLSEKLQGLSTSSAQLSKIIKVGDENFKSYSYFC